MISDNADLIELIEMICMAYGVLSWPLKLSALLAMGTLWKWKKDRILDAVQHLKHVTG